MTWPSFLLPLRHPRAGHVVRAASGELEPADESRLRGHLRGCDVCRRRYDAIGDVMDAAADAGRSAAGHERSRLVAALGGRVPPEAEGAASSSGRRRPRWPLMLAPTLGAAVALVAVLRSDPPPAPEVEVQWRGDDRATASDEALAASRAGLVLRFYASRRQDGTDAPGPLRFIGELPASGELTASRRDYLQIAYAGLTEPRHLVVVGVDETGIVHRYHPRADPSPLPQPLPPSDEPRPLGPSIDLAVAHVAGRVRVVAIVSQGALSPDEVAAAGRRSGSDGGRLGGSGAFGGVLVLAP